MNMMISYQELVRTFPNNKLLIDVSVSMPAAIALDIILPHMSKSIFTEKLAANFGLAAFPLLN